MDEVSGGLKWKRLILMEMRTHVKRDTLRDMKYILSRESRPLLRDLDPRDSILAFDFDGTLAPIVTDRDAARMPARTRALLRKLTRCYRCAVISGRSMRDLVPRLSGMKFEFLAGNHGVEWSGSAGDSSALRRRVRSWLRRLRDRLGDQDGIEFEDKTYSLTIHFRRARNRARAERTILRAARAMRGARIVGGKCVVNLVPARGADKGSAILGIWRRSRARSVLYVGDDVTDEDVFALSGRSGLVTVRIRASRKSRAEYFLREQKEIDRLLRALLENCGEA